MAGVRAHLLLANAIIILLSPQSRLRMMNEQRQRLKPGGQALAGGDKATSEDTAVQTSVRPIRDAQAV